MAVSEAETILRFELLTTRLKHSFSYYANGLFVSSPPSKVLEVSTALAASSLVE